MRDPYEVLGIQRGATDDEIKKAYRAKCKRWHPDLNPNDPTAEEHFKEVQAAYDAITKGETGPQMGGNPYGGYRQQSYGGSQQGYRLGGGVERFVVHLQGRFIADRQHFHIEDALFDCRAYRDVAAVRSVTPAVDQVEFGRDGSGKIEENSRYFCRVDVFSSCMGKISAVMIGRKDGGNKKVQP